MHRFRKLLGMIFIFGIVFFIICDEKGYKIGLENNQIVLNKIEKKSDFVEVQFDPNAVYKNSDLIRINPEFQNPKSLRESDGVDRKYIAKLEKEEKIREQEKQRANNKTFEDDTILSAFQGSEGNNTGIMKEDTNQNSNTKKVNVKEGSGIEKKEINQNTGTKKEVTKESDKSIKQNKKIKKEDTNQNTGTVKKETKTRTTKKDVKYNTGTANKNSKGTTGKVSDSKNKTGVTEKIEVPKPVVVYYPVKRYEHSGHSLNLSKGAEIPKVKIEKYHGREILAVNLMKGKEPGPLYKNSNRIKIYSGFENPIALRNSAGIDEEFLMRQKNSKPTIISLNDNDTISSARQNNYSGIEQIESSGSYNDNSDFFDDIEIVNTDTGINSTENNILDVEESNVTGTIEDIEDKDLENLDSQHEIKIETGNVTEEKLKQEITYKVEKYKIQHNSISLSKGEEPEKILVKVEKYEPETHAVNIKNGVIEENYIAVEKPELFSHTSNLSKGEEPEKILVKVEKYEPETHIVGIKNGIDTEITQYENVDESVDENVIEFTDDEQEQDNVEYFNEQDIETVEEENYVIIEAPTLYYHPNYLRKGEEPKIILVKVEKYQAKDHPIYLKKGKAIKHDFVVENTETIEQPENGLSNAMLDSLLENEEIDINTLESENDEFLQKVFEETKDTDVMNLIVETYLNEYQFVKAKNFIENLPDMYLQDLKPSLNLRVGFNSFSLSSKTISENLTSLVQDYSSKNEIADEDKKRYLGVIALMDRNYDRFFEIATGFTSEKNIGFTSKLQGYKDQIAKQMGMPDYYFDTLVSLELFNQGLFQPAKVLALYSLQQNSSYILPYQVLAYANFLTNSRDTSIEYLKKLVDLDPNNAEKYRFLMGIAFYRDEKYEQSVVMLSMIKDESLRLDTQRYLINDYLKLDQKNKLISSRNKLLGYENLVASDFYTYFYETFFHPYSQGEQFQLYAYDTDLANKMLRVCSITLQSEEKAVCTYGTIGRNIAMGQFDGLEQYLLNLAAEYPQGYLYQALGDYYIQQGDLEKAKVYLIKAISLTQKKSERSQIKKLLQDTMQ